jgi:tRNA(fMet)-specific endonuclease VapC
MNYVLDTNLIIHLIRSSDTWQFVDLTHGPLGAGNRTHLCFASVAEILSLATGLGWGEKKMAELISWFSQVSIIGTAGDPNEKLLKSYVAIDTHSQGKHPTFALPAGLTARNMGKNDLWIAATAHALEATLLTTDQEFSHLDTVFCKVVVE